MSFRGGLLRVHKFLSDMWSNMWSELISDVQAFSEIPSTRWTFLLWTRRLLHSSSHQYRQLYRLDVVPCLLCGYLVAGISTVMICNHWYWPRLLFFTSPKVSECQRDWLCHCFSSLSLRDHLNVCSSTNRLMGFKWSRVSNEAWGVLRNQLRLKVTRLFEIYQCFLSRKECY